MQNRTSAYSADPNDQQVYNAYEGYPMLTAFPGQNITLTWPRTADPDGTVPDGSSAVNIYYNPDSSINAGQSEHECHSFCCRQDCTVCLQASVATYTTNVKYTDQHMPQMLP